MKKNYEMKVKLRCNTCGDTTFEYNEDKTWAKCIKCGREYPHGYDELVELNQSSINSKKDEMTNEVLNDLKEVLTKRLKSVVKGNKNFKFK